MEPTSTSADNFSFKFNYLMWNKLGTAKAEQSNTVADKSKKLQELISMFLFLNCVPTRLLLEVLATDVS